MQGLNEELLRVLLTWLPDKERFGTVARLSREFSVEVWKPDFNHDLRLDFRPAKKCVAVAMLKARGADFLFSTIWAGTRRIEIFGDSFEIIDSVHKLNAVEEIRLCGPSSEFVAALFNSDCWTSLHTLVVSEVRCDSIESLFGLGNPFSKFRNLKKFVLNEIFLVTLNKGQQDNEDLPVVPTNENMLEHVELYLIPFTEVVDFVGNFFGHSFPNLKTLKFKCLSSPRDSSLLASVLGELRMPVLEEFEAGVLTGELMDFLERATNWSLRRLVIPSRISVSNEQLVHFLHTCQQLEFLSVRVGSSTQVDELSDTLTDNQLNHVELQWNTVNAISVHSLVKLRGALKHFSLFHVSVRSLEAFRETSVSEKNNFDQFYAEICKDRIVCECDECEEDGVNEEHVIELAMEEWDALEQTDRNIFSNS